MIGKEFWGRGYASETASMLIEYAFNVKHLSRVVAMIKPENRGSENVAGKCGMKFEKDILRMEDIRMKLYAIEKNQQ